MSGGGQQPTTQTQTTEPPAYLAPFLKDTATQAQKIYQTGGPAYFPGQTVAPLSEATQQGIAQTTALANQGGTLTPAANETLLKTIQGQDVNPYLAGAVKSANAPLYEQFQQETIPTLQSIFARSGGTGGSAEGFAAERAATALGRGVSENAANLAYQSASQERQNQLNASQLAPQLDAARYNDANALMKVGATQQGQTQAEIDAAINKYNYEQNLPSMTLNQYIQQLIAGGSGKGITSTSGSQNAGVNRTGAIIGGLLGGTAGAFGGPMGAAAGATAGAGIGGYF